jgi:hypothetical protein
MRSDMPDLATLRAAAIAASDPKLYGAASVRADLAYRAHATPAAIVALVDEVVRLREACRCACGMTIEESGN